MLSAHNSFIWQLANLVLHESSYDYINCQSIPSSSVPFASYIIPDTAHTSGAT
jgi:hypothetical protein